MISSAVISFEIESKSSGETYRLTATQIEGGLSFTCTCKAGAIGQQCRHRTDILYGDVSEVPATAIENAQLIGQWLQGTSLEKSLSDLVALERAHGQLKKQIGDKKKEIGRLMAG
jgi:hypothetical protein